MKTAQQRFEACVPKDQREDVLMMLAGATGEWDTHECVTILDRDRLDAINVRAHGIIKIGDNEYTFSFRDGNNDGSVLEDWESEVPWEPVKRTEWSLQPRRDLVSQAIAAGNGPFLIQKWDIIAQRPDVSGILRKYAYDRMAQPGCVIESYYKKAAAKHQLEIVCREEADQTRSRLLQATYAVDSHDGSGK